MDRYRALYGLGADIVATGPRPRMTFEGWRLNEALLYYRHLNDIGHFRSPGRKTIKPGEVVLLCVARPTPNEARDARIATPSIAQNRMEDVIGSLDGLHGLILAPQECRLYYDFVQSLLTNLPTMSARSLPSATSAMCTLLKVALEAHGRREPVAESKREGARLSRLRLLVDTRLSDPLFDAEVAIAESGFSRATLYRLLRPHQGLARYIQLRRLEHVRRALSDPLDARTLARVFSAAGFATESYASKAFLLQYGLRPSDYRSAIAEAAATVDPIGQFRAWQHDLR